MKYKMKKPYVHSNYKRIKDDNYQTIDTRCVQALIDSSGMIDKGQRIIDCCSNQGSGIVARFIELGYNAHCVDNAFDTSTSADLNIFNPPYDRKVVDKIIWHQIKGLEQERFKGIAVLVRNNFDFAKSRWDMFKHDLYAGQIHMMFRPYWSTERKSSPIHNYVWHLWTNPNYGEPFVEYWKEE